MMSFMRKTVNRSLPIWDACLETPFIRELRLGTLPEEKFLGYMVQDSIYLKHYARVYGRAIYSSTVLKDIQVFYSILSFLTESESAVRLRYLKEAGLTDDDIEGYPPLPENRNYIAFMLDIAERGNVAEILMAVLPCMFSYSYIFRKLAEDETAAGSLYWDFIADYGEEAYYEDCIGWCEFADSKCGGLPAGKQAELQKIFERASLLELDFWNMAYGAHEQMGKEI